MVGRTIYRGGSSGKPSAHVNGKASPGVAGNAPSGTRVNPGVKNIGKLSVPEPANGAAYGAAYHLGPQRLVVTAPGEVAAVTLSDNGPLGVGIKHEAGSAELLVSIAGDYLMEFALYVTSDSAKQAVFALQTNNSHIAGGVWDVALRSGYQAVTGFTMAHLEEGSRIRIVMTAASPLEVTLSGSGTTAALSARKL